MGQSLHKQKVHPIAFKRQSRHNTLSYCIKDVCFSLSIDKTSVNELAVISECLLNTDSDNSEILACPFGVCMNWVSVYKLYIYNIFIQMCFRIIIHID